MNVENQIVDATAVSHCFVHTYCNFTVFM